MYSRGRSLPFVNTFQNTPGSLFYMLFFVMHLPQQTIYLVVKASES